MRGQIISIDALTAITIFTVLISLVLFFSNTIDYRATTVEDSRIAREKLIDLSDRFITTSGDPTFWHINGTDIKSIGLAYDDHKLSSDKIYALNVTSKTDYENLRHILNMETYHVYTELLTMNDTLNCTVTSGAVVFNLSAGKVPLNEKNSLSINRLIKMDDGRFCKLRIWVWK